ncbi:MAG: hypothetical protein EBV77_13885 [Gemmatimonadaceae bacterium]|nr:hypothetical protein [Gemmatimonadaceae bacterium]
MFELFEVLMMKILNYLLSSEVSEIFVILEMIAVEVIWNYQMRKMMKKMNLMILVLIILN